MNHTAKLALYLQEDSVETELGLSRIKKQETLIWPIGLDRLQARRFWIIRNSPPTRRICIKAYSSKESTRNLQITTKNLCQLIPNRTVSLTHSQKSRKLTSIWSYKSSSHGKLEKEIVMAKRVVRICPILPEAVSTQWLSRWIKWTISCWFKHLIMRQEVIILFSQFLRYQRGVTVPIFNLQALKTFRWLTLHKE